MDVWSYVLAGLVLLAVFYAFRKAGRDAAMRQELEEALDRVDEANEAKQDVTPSTVDELLRKRWLRRTLQDDRDSDSD